MLSYPCSPEVERNENLTQDYAGVPMQRAVAAEVARCFLFFEQQSALSYDTIAQELLTSYDEMLGCDLAQAPVFLCDTARILAHLVSLELELPDDVLASVARRVVVLFLNRVVHAQRRPEARIAVPERRVLPAFDVPLPTPKSAVTPWVAPDPSRAAPAAPEAQSPSARTVLPSEQETLARERSLAPLPPRSRQRRSRHRWDSVVRGGLVYDPNGELLGSIYAEPADASRAVQGPTKTRAVLGHVRVKSALRFCGGVEIREGAIVELVEPNRINDDGIRREKKKSRDFVAIRWAYTSIVPVEALDWEGVSKEAWLAQEAAGHPWPARKVREALEVEAEPGPERVEPETPELEPAELAEA